LEEPFYGRKKFHKEEQNGNHNSKNPKKSSLEQDAVKMLQTYAKNL